MKKKLLSLTVLGLLGAFSLTSCGAKAFPNKGQRFCIGCSGPLTGDAAMYGLGVKNGAQLAVDEINTNGGVNGTLIDFAILDDQCEATKAATNFTTLKESGMQVSLGCVTSGACLEYNVHATKAGNQVFCLTPSATNDDVPNGTKGIYQVCFKDSAQGTLAINYMNEHFAGQKIGVFYDASDDYSKGIYDTFEREFDGEYVTASFTKDAKEDFSNQIQTLKECKVIFLPIYYTEAALFIRQAKNVVASDAIYFGCDGLDGIDAIQGFNVNEYTQEISYLSHFNPKATSGDTGDFINAYKAKYGSANNNLNQFGAAAYDAIYILAELIKKAQTNHTFGPEIDSNTLYGYLQEAMNGFTYSGVTSADGPMSWDLTAGTVIKQPIRYVVNG